MSIGARILFAVAVVAGMVVVEAPAAYAEDYGWKDGKWRLELSGFAAIRSGNESRTGDFGFAGSVEYEVPLTKRLTFGIKAYPMYFMDQNDAGDDRVYGAGIGPELRMYFKGTEHRGFFFEIGSAVLVTKGRLDGNSGAVNFLDEGGIGYKFKSDWHVTAKFSHVSNAGFASSNAGVNSLGLAMGYTF